MVIVATSDAQLATALGEAINDVDGYITRVDSPTDLRHQVHSRQPTVVVLDVRLGKNTFRSLGEVPGILMTRSRPAVIVILPWESKDVRREAVKLGCFDVIYLGQDAFGEEVAHAVDEAKAARAAGFLASVPPVTLH